MSYSDKSDHNVLYRVSSTRVIYTNFFVTSFFVEDYLIISIDKSFGSLKLTVQKGASNNISKRASHSDASTYTYTLPPLSLSRSVITGGTTCKIKKDPTEIQKYEIPIYKFLKL